MQAVDNDHRTDVSSQKFRERLATRLGIKSGNPDVSKSQNGAMSFMWKTIPFILVLLAFVFTIAFPEPKDFFAVNKILPTESAVGLVPTESAPTVSMLAYDTPSAPYISRIEQSGCLDKLGLLPQELIEKCSELVSQAVIQIAQFEALDENNLTTESGLLVERLRLAAANVCRARWVNEPSLTFDNADPVCAVSTLVLARSNYSE